MAEIQAVGSGLADNVLSTAYGVFESSSDILSVTEKCNQIRVLMQVFSFVGESCFRLTGTRP